MGTQGAETCDYCTQQFSAICTKLLSVSQRLEAAGHDSFTCSDGALGNTYMWLKGETCFVLVGKTVYDLVKTGPILQCNVKYHITIHQHR